MKNTSPVNYQEFKSLLGEDKRNSDPLLCKTIYRPLSFPAGWFIYKIGMTANSVSLLSIFLAIISSFIMIFGGADKIMIASILMGLIALFDCIDGNIARARGETGPNGEWMDALSGYLVYALLPLSLGLHLNLHSEYQTWPALWVFVGALTSIANLFPRLLHQKFINGMIGSSSSIGLKKSGSIFSIISGEMGLVGWMMPSLIFSSIINKLEVYLFIYCFFYTISAVLITLVLIRRVCS